MHPLNKTFLPKLLEMCYYTLTEVAHVITHSLPLGKKTCWWVQEFSTSELQLLNSARQNNGDFLKNDLLMFCFDFRI